MDIQFYMLFLFYAVPVLTWPQSNTLIMYAERKCKMHFGKKLYNDCPTEREQRKQKKKEHQRHRINCK